MNKSFKHLPPNERKKIVIVCDDIRVHSGVATVAKEIVTHTASHFNWVNVGGAINHPEKGKVLDLSEAINKEQDITDSNVKIYCVDGYGKDEEIRQVLEVEKPDAILLFTDPRYFTHIFNMEDDIRQKCPIAYINIWDDYPAPRYNQAFYESCDLLMGISKQTKNINELVLADVDTSKKVFKYVPHGLNHEHYFPITRDHDDYKEMQIFRNNMFKGEDVDYVLFFNSRNIRRKQIPDTMLAFRHFLDGLPQEKADKCRMVLHTEISTDHGTDLEQVREFLFDEKYPKAITFSLNKVNRKQLNFMYNIADAQVLLTSNEGWGLTLTEAILAGTPIIANVTGGMQDQMRFEDKDSNWIEFNSNFPSNHRGTYKKHGEWALPVYPSNLSLVGSPRTPYIWDDRCNAEDAAKQIEALYNMGDKERKRIGKIGREWVLGDEAGFTAEKMSNKVIDGMDELFIKFKPKSKFTFTKDTDIDRKVLNHKLIY